MFDALKPVPTTTRILTAARCALAASVLSPALACAQDAPKVFIGSANLIAETPIVSLPSGEYRSGEPVSLVLFDLRTHEVTITIAALGDVRDDETDKREDRTSYAVTLATMPNQLVGFAYVGTLPRLTVEDGRVTMDVTGDGVPEDPSFCITPEGLMLRARKIDPVLGAVEPPLWDATIALPYETEPTCP